MTARRRTCLLAAPALLVSACASVRPDPDWRAPLRAALPSAGAPAAPGPRQRHVLALSTGGADGAFGAGVLVGWTRSGTRPAFDVVSGVSVGALQAPLAFLGPGQDPLLERVFTTIRTSDVLAGNGVGGLVGSGLSDQRPLRATLGRLLTEGMMDAIADGHLGGRRLYVTTTDLTNGRAVTWDAGALAASGLPRRREALIEILLASASPPGLVEPVPLPDPITGDVVLHGDGGVKRPLVVDPWMLSGGPRDTVWLVANGHVSREAATVLRGARTLALVQRGVAQMLRSLTYQTVAGIHALARDRGAAFRIQFIPDGFPEARNPLVFDPTEMRGLFAVGQFLGAQQGAWRASPPS